MFSVLGKLSNLFTARGGIALGVVALGSYMGLGAIMGECPMCVAGKACGLVTAESSARNIQLAMLSVEPEKPAADAPGDKAPASKSDEPAKTQAPAQTSGKTGDAPSMDDMTKTAVPVKKTAAGANGTPAGNGAAKPEAKADAPAAKAEVKTQVAMFGAGCFWGVESKFRSTPGVLATEVGYSGGNVEHPTYKLVCSDATGHVEVVRVVFDPTVVSYDKLVELFFKLHDPTQVNRQGPDYGVQYRSVIFFLSPEQKTAAENIKKRLGDAKTYARPIATAIEPAKAFWRAEEYHQQYLEKRGQTDCHLPG